MSSSVASDASRSASLGGASACDAGSWTAPSSRKGLTGVDDGSGGGGRLGGGGFRPELKIADAASFFASGVTGVVGAAPSLGAFSGEAGASRGGGRSPSSKGTICDFRAAGAPSSPPREDSSGGVAPADDPRRT